MDRGLAFSVKASWECYGISTERERGSLHRIGRAGSPMFSQQVPNDRITTRRGLMSSAHVLWEIYDPLGSDFTAVDQGYHMPERLLKSHIRSEKQRYRNRELVII